MSYILYTGNNCHDCAEVVKTMELAGLSFKAINVDESVEQPPVFTFVFPALFENGELKAYGRDVMRYLGI